MEDSLLITGDGEGGTENMEDSLLITGDGEGGTENMEEGEIHN